MYIYNENKSMPVCAFNTVSVHQTGSSVYTARYVCVCVLPEVRSILVVLFAKVV